MAPKKRPSVKSILENPFIQNIRLQMDSKFFGNGAQFRPTAPSGLKEVNFDFNDFVPQNFQNQHWKKDKKITTENKPKPKTANWKVESSRQINRSQEPSKNYFKVKENKFHSSQQNEVPKNPNGYQMFQSNRQIQSMSNQNNSFYKNNSMNQSNPQARANRNGGEKGGNGGYLNGHKLFQSYNEKVFNEGGKCKTEPSSLAKEVNYSNGHGKGGQKNFSVFSKKKKISSDLIQKDFSKFGANLFKKKQEVVFQKINNKHKFLSFHSKMHRGNSRENVTFEKRDSSKENKNEVESGQIDEKEPIITGKRNLKKLLKKHQIQKGQKAKKSTPKNADKHGSTKKNLSKNFISNQKKQHFELGRSFNNESLKKRFGHNHSGFRKDLSREQNQINNQSMGMPVRKMKQQKSVKYINCDWKQPSSHVKSHSFNDMTLKTKLVLRRKDSIQDLRKKLSTRKIESILQKPRHKSNFLNVSYNNQLIANDKPKTESQPDYSRMGLKRNHSMATGLVPKMTKTIRSSGKNPVVQKTLHGMIHHFKLNSYEKRAPISNVFQLGTNNQKTEKTKSFCFSHRVDNLNPKSIMSKLKGMSQRNIAKNGVGVPGKTSFTKVYQSAQNSSSRYQEPQIKTKYVSRNEHNWKSKFIQN